jgi:hypothetical protein
MKTLQKSFNMPCYRHSLAVRKLILQKVLKCPAMEIARLNLNLILYSKLKSHQGYRNSLTMDQYADLRLKTLKTPGHRNSLTYSLFQYQKKLKNAGPYMSSDKNFTKVIRCRAIEMAWLDPYSIKKTPKLPGYIDSPA